MLSAGRLVECRHIWSNLLSLPPADFVSRLRAPCRGCRLFRPLSHNDGSELACWIHVAYICNMLYGAVLYIAPGALSLRLHHHFHQLCLPVHIRVAAAVQVQHSRALGRGHRGGEHRGEPGWELIAPAALLRTVAATTG